MQESGIIFKQEMVIAILAGIKTKTRRLKGLKEINKNPDDWSIHNKILKNSDNAFGALFFNIKTKKQKIIKLPYGYKGDIIWVRETYRKVEHSENGFKYFYKANASQTNLMNKDVKWNPSLFMPKRAARIWLEIIDVKLERLQEITEDDAFEEGAKPCTLHSQTGNYIFYYGFQKLWQSINGNESWHFNPWVWVYSFKKLK